MGLAQLRGIDAMHADLARRAAIGRPHPQRVAIADVADHAPPRICGMRGRAHQACKNPAQSGERTEHDRRGEQTMGECAARSTPGPCMMPEAPHPPARRPWRRFFPFLAWPRPGRATLQGEAMAGLTVGMMVIPQGVAYAALAGMPLVTGIYASLLPALIAVLFSASTRLGVGPTALTSLLI